MEASSAALEAAVGEGGEEGFVPVFFTPRSPPANLELIDRVESLCPVVDMKVANLLGEDVPQIYAVCGRGPRSSLRLLRPGLSVTEMAVSQVPGAPTGVWTVRRAAADEYDSYIVVSFANATLVLKVGETVEQADDSGLAAGVHTLRVQHLADDSLLQVTAQGLRHVRPDGRVNEWRAPGSRGVARAATNARQVVIALKGGELVYFELSAQGMLVETERKDLGGEVASIDIATVPEGRQRTRFLAVSTYDNSVRLLSLDPGDALGGLALKTVAAIPESVLLLDSPATGQGGGDEGAGAGALFLQIGLANGVLVRIGVDAVTGALHDERMRFLGPRAPRLSRVVVRGEPAMLALSTRPWLGYSDQGRFNLVPVSYDQLDFAARELWWFL